MQGIIESLSPEHADINWKWVGSVFALDVAVMIGVAAVLIAR